MLEKKSIYVFSYNTNEEALCQLESRQLFGVEEKDKQLISDLVIEPSQSAFIKKRLEVICYAKDYEDLLLKIKQQELVCEGFKVEYVVLEDDDAAYSKRLERLADVGYIIEGLPNMTDASTVYGICCYQDCWCFGVLTRNNYEWKRHQQKPRSFSNSLNHKMAKAIVNIATRGDRELRLLDACCGVGTVLLEACYNDVSIVGCDVNWRVCVQSRENLAHFDYQAEVLRSDIADVESHYDVTIVDLPYNLFSDADISTLEHIISSASQRADRMIIVSTIDISAIIEQVHFRVTDRCSVKKRGKKHFERHIWVCDKEKNCKFVSLPLF